jgi:hypothetical protein
MQKRGKAPKKKGEEERREKTKKKGEGMVQK